jgi:hypothetical protein
VKKNKKTLKLATIELTPLTRRILAQMGPEGQVIHGRLKKFLYELTPAHLKIVERAASFGSER